MRLRSFAHLLSSWRQFIGGFTFSLRARLLLWLLVPLAPFVAVTLMVSHEVARQTADIMQDASLLSSARTILESVQWVDGRPAVTVLPAFDELADSPGQDRLYYKVVTADNALLVGAPGLTVPERDLRQPVFYNCHYDNAPVRAVAFARELYNDGLQEPVTVVVARTQNARRATLGHLWRPQLLGELLMLVLVTVLVPLGLAVELTPLIRLKDDVAGRKPMQIEPIRATGLPRELGPIVDAINRCIAEIETHTQTQRQFVADAAHQLCTPLALIDTQIQFAHRTTDCAASGKALDGARRSIHTMKAMTSQLLLLAQAESAPVRSGARTDLAAVTASVLEELIVAAQARDIDLGAEFEPHTCVAGDAALFTALVSNLVDNAIRYTQAGGCVTAVVRRAGAFVVLEVIDNGPGIAAEWHARAFERFWRGASTVEGSGLGLPIVREIAQRHGGTVELGPGRHGAGLTVAVRLPVCNEPETRTSR